MTTPWRWRAAGAPIVAAALLLIGMVVLSRDFGFTWDERFQQKYGEEIWDYLHGRLARSSFDTDLGNQYLYGGLVELTAVAVQHVVRADVYVVRHMVTSAFGWLGIVMAGLAAGSLFGRRAGWLAAVLLAVSPRYFADAMNNPKDAPFAAFAMTVLYLTLTIEPRAPVLTWRRTAALIVAVAAAINVRPLGIVLLVYALGSIAVAMIWARDRSWAGVARLGTLGALAVPAGTLAWPWAQASPFVRPVEGFVITSRLDWARGFDVLFGGRNLGAGDLPWTYVPTWLWISTPPVVIAGVVLSAAVLHRGALTRARWAGLAAFALAPIVAAVVRNATIYDGIRHLEFVVPPLAVLAAGGWSAMLETTRPLVRWSAVGVLALGLAEPVLFHVRNHPHQAVYFQALAGGPRAAFARYDMDYWGNSVLGAVEWADNLARRSGFPLIVSGNPIQAVEADAARYRALQTVPRASQAYHLDIRLMRGPKESLEAFAQRPDIIYAVRTADGTPLTVVLPGPAYLSVSDRLRFETDVRSER